MRIQASHQDNSLREHHLFPVPGPEYCSRGQERWRVIQVYDVVDAQVEEPALLRAVILGLYDYHGQAGELFADRVYEVVQVIGGGAFVNDYGIKVGLAETHGRFVRRSCYLMPKPAFVQCLKNRFLP